MSRETKDTNGNTVHAAYAAYDESQNVSMHVEKLKSANGTLKSYKTRYVYDRDDRTAATLFGEDADTTRTTLIYDGLGRVTNRKTYNGSSCTVTESYTYAPGYTGYSANATTDLVTGMSQTGMVQSYAYDDNGRIASWTCNNKKCSYGYDSIGQLIRVNDEKDTRGGTEGTTWTYEYDNGGNILTRKRYAYTEGTLPALPDAVDTWTYNTGWKDKLAKFNGVDIDSDDIGNIENDGNWSYTWEGRKLVGMSNNSKNITFLYDENGQRIRKAVTENGNTVTTEYVVSGKSVTHVIRGTEDLHIFYANGQPSHCKYGNSMYTYVYSMQGDVLGLKDSSGNLVVTYLYDAWGTVISTGGTLAGTLGAINPFRYRGYVYDEETEIYYIRSRYYASSINRWIGSDACITIYEKFIGHNLFVYCENNPICLHDIEGYSAAAAVVKWQKSMSWMSQADGPFVIGDTIYLGGIIVLGGLAIVESLFIINTVNDDLPDEIETPDVEYTGDDPTKEPSDDYEWRGKPPKGGKKGAYANKSGSDSWHPDLDHEQPIGPHWDYNDGLGHQWRVFPDGTIKIKF